MQIEKNEKFKKSPICKGIIYFNPYHVQSNVQMEKVYATPLHYYTTDIFTNQTTNPADWGVTVGDVMLLGGQVGLFVNNIALDGSNYNIEAAIPYGTYLVSAGANVWQSEKEFDIAYFFDAYFKTSDYSCAFWWNDGADNITQILTTSDPIWDNPNIIKNAEIIEYEVVKNQATFGHHHKTYQSSNVYKVKVAFPYKTPMAKIDQLFQSEAVAFQMDDRETFDYDNTYAYEFHKQLGGSSISPLVRKLSLITGSLKMITKRDRYEVSAYLEG